ncbi:hypothetical protein R1sor_014230 [Riccia sorocarpa]|uniref:DDE Tnp4 domain-containing protein n=1 Tax=Riccia sorocarpa TaxID=122646 RepID=A0ABD3HAM9_9MARC
MSKITFSVLLTEIEGHPVFQSTGKKPQAPVVEQLAVALDRFGHNGNGACLRRTLQLWGVAHGTLCLYTKRVVVGLQDQIKSYVRWPTAIERKRISARFARKGFPGCVGLVDGTLLPLAQRPRDYGETYFDRKCNYSLNAQIICDDLRNITYCSVGMPGSTHDITALRKAPIWKHFRRESQIFSRGQYILGDSTYNPPMPHLIGSFKVSRTVLTEEFNKCVAHARAVNEHCIGVLKARWFSLKQIRTQLKCKAESKHVVQWVECYVMLHDFCLRYNDTWTEEDSQLELDEDLPASFPPAARWNTDREIGDELGRCPLYKWNRAPTRGHDSYGIAPQQGGAILLGE